MSTSAALGDFRILSFEQAASLGDRHDAKVVDQAEILQPPGNVLLQRESVLLIAGC